MQNDRPSENHGTRLCHPSCDPLESDEECVAVDPVAVTRVIEGGSTVNQVVPTVDSREQLPDGSEW